MSLGTEEIARSVTKPGIDETANEFRYRIRDPGDFTRGSFRRGTVKRDRPRVFAIYGRLKSEPDGGMKMQSLRFPKADGWTRQKVRGWISDHPDIGKQVYVNLPEEDWEKAEAEETKMQNGDLRAKLLALKDTLPSEKVVKHFTAVEVKDINDEEKTLTAVVNSERIDRDWEVVEPKAVIKAASEFVALHPVLLSSHVYSTLLRQIGEVISVRYRKSDGMVVATNKYYVGEGNPEADWAWILAAKHNIAAFSIGFIPKKAVVADIDDDAVWEKVKAGEIPWRTFTEIELLEISQVLVPSNPDAVARAVDKGLIDGDKSAVIVEAKDIPTDDLSDLPAEEDVIIDDTEDSSGDGETGGEVREEGKAPAADSLAEPPSPAADEIIEDVEDEVKTEEKRTLVLQTVSYIDVDQLGNPTHIAIVKGGETVAKLSLENFISVVTGKAHMGEVDLTFRIADFNVGIDPKSLIEALSALNQRFLSQFRDALAKAQPKLDLPADSAAHVSVKDLMEVIVDTAEKISRKIALAELEKARGRVEYHLNR